jgi:hypothetical protein
VTWSATAAEQRIQVHSALFYHPETHADRLVHVRSRIQFFALLLVHVPAASVVFSTLYLLSDPSPRRYLQLVLHVRARSSASVPALLGQMFLPLISSFLLGESTQLQKGNLSAAERGLSEKGTKFVFCRF